MWLYSTRNLNDARLKCRSEIAERKRQGIVRDRPAIFLQRPPHYKMEIVSSSHQVCPFTAYINSSQNDESLVFTTPLLVAQLSRFDKYFPGGDAQVHAPVGVAHLGEPLSQSFLIVFHLRFV